MKKSDILEIAIRILALYLFMTSVFEAVQGVFSIYAFVADAKQHSETEGQNILMPLVVVAIGNLVFLTAASLFFFFKAKFIVRKVCSAADFEENVKLFADSKTILEVGLVLTGLAMIVFTLPEYGYRLTNYIRMAQSSLFHDQADTKFLINLTIKILVGVFVVLLAKPLAQFFAGNKKQTDEPN